MKKIRIALMAIAMASLLALSAGCSSSSSTASASGAVSGAASAEASASASAGQAAPIDAANLADGEYQVAVTLSGGSGKASVESPAKLVVSGGKMKAVIVWSSPNYDQMIVDGTDYYPVPRPGNSTFEIPVSGFDQELPVQAETTAMSEPHMIDYTLNFDSASLGVWES